MTEFLTLQPEAAEAVTEIMRAAHWIWSAHPFDLHECYVDFRAEVELDAESSAAVLYVTADSRYRVWVNGHYVAHGPERCYPQAQSVDALEVSDRVRAGRNLIAVQVYQPGYSHFAYAHRAAAGLLAVLQVGGQTRLATGSTWQVRRNPSWCEHVARVSIYGSGVEQRDLRADDAWMLPDYQPGSPWPNARVVGPALSYPWTALTARRLPLLITRELALGAPSAEHQVQTRADDPVWDLLEHDPHAFVRALYPRSETDAPTAILAEGILSAQRRGEAEQFHTDYSPRLRASVLEDPPEQTSRQVRFVLFDLGRDYTGHAWASVNSPDGAQVLITYLEKFAHGQLVISDPGTYCRVRLTDSFTVGPGVSRCEAFTPRGGRYVLFTLIDQASAAFGFRADEYPLPALRPALADPELEAIAAMCERTLRACLSDGFVDSTWRESSTWVGDALPQALSLRVLGGNLGPLARVLELSAQGAYPDGVLPSVVPGDVHAYTIVDYNFMWVALLQVFVEQGGPRPAVLALWPTLTRMLERFADDVDPGDGLLRSQPGRRLFLDWAPVSRQEPSAIYNLQALHALRTAASLANQLGRSAQASGWSLRADALEDAVRAAFWDGARWWDDQARTTCSQLAAALAVRAGAARRDEAPALLDTIVARSLDLGDTYTPGEMVLASPFRHHDLFEALRAHGRRADVLAIIRARWGRWARSGEPTTWENWDVSFADGSTCHAFSAHPLYHLVSAT